MGTPANAILILHAAGAAEAAELMTQHGVSVTETALLEAAGTDPAAIVADDFALARTRLRLGLLRLGEWTTKGDLRWLGGSKAAKLAVLQILRQSRPANEASLAWQSSAAATGEGAGCDPEGGHRYDAASADRTLPASLHSALFIKWEVIPNHLQTPFVQLAGRAIPILLGRSSEGGVYQLVLRFRKVMEPVSGGLGSYVAQVVVREGAREHLLGGRLYLKWTRANDVQLQNNIKSYWPFTNSPAILSRPRIEDGLRQWLQAYRRDHQSLTAGFTPPARSRLHPQQRPPGNPKPGGSGAGRGQRRFVRIESMNLDWTVVEMLEQGKSVEICKLSHNGRVARLALFFTTKTPGGLGRPDQVEGKILLDGRVIASVTLALSTSDRIGVERVKFGYGTFLPEGGMRRLDSKANVLLALDQWVDDYNSAED